MRARRAERTALMLLFMGVVLTFAAAFVAISRAEAASPNSTAWNTAAAFVLAQNTAPRTPQIPVSSPNQGASPEATAAGGGTATNPITGLPCNGEGSTAMIGVLPGAYQQNETGNPDETFEGLPLPPSGNIDGPSAGSC